MTTFLNKTALLSLLLIFLTSCVAKKDFDSVVGEKNALENDKTRLQEQLAVLGEKASRLEVQVEDLKGNRDLLL